MRGIMLGGTHSGCGKTAITCGILQALVDRKMKTTAFKCGPDYIDPMFHSKVIGADSYNLDGFFCEENTLQYLFAKHGDGADISVIEGVMGFYDGEKASPHELSKMLGVPSVVIADCKGAGENSIGAVVKGFLTYKMPNNIVGFIFNRLSDKLAPRVRSICAELGTEFLGFMPTCHEAALESRHLGLVTAGEITCLKDKVRILAEKAERFIEIDRLLELSERCNARKVQKPDILLVAAKKTPIIAIARDKAFCFIYRDNIELLQELGCEISYFSPLEDRHVPKNADGIILCGGYPELYAEKLSENREMLSDMRGKILCKMPVIAECGGFMYLHKSLENADGKFFSMAEVINGSARKTNRLQRFGYLELTAEKDNLLCEKGEKIRAHEFHYWESDNCGNDFSAVKPSNGKQWRCVHASENLYAGFPHLYFYSNPKIAANFVKKCSEYRETYGKN